VRPSGPPARGGCILVMPLQGRSEGTLASATALCGYDACIDPD